MEGYQWIHPIVGICTLALLGTTAWTKLRPKKRFRLHYALGLLTVAASVVTIGLGVYTALRVLNECNCTDAFPAVLFAHFPFDDLLLLLILGQATMGLGMLLFGRKNAIFRVHRFNARIILSLAALVLATGVTTIIVLLS